MSDKQPTIPPETLARAEAVISALCVGAFFGPDSCQLLGHAHLTDALKVLTAAGVPELHERVTRADAFIESLKTEQGLAMLVSMRGFPLPEELGAMWRELDDARAENARLTTAIGEHHAQKADDRCVEDDDRLYAAAGLPLCDRRVGDKAAMLANCARYIERRCEGGGWPSYVELEAQRDAAIAQHAEYREMLATVHAQRDAALELLREMRDKCGSICLCDRIDKLLGTVA